MGVFVTDFRDKAPTTASEAASIILDRVRRDRWRILVGDDAIALDEVVREVPEEAYEPVFIDMLHERGHFRWLVAAQAREGYASEIGHPLSRHVADVTSPADTV